MGETIAYFYLHTNNKLIEKSKYIVESDSEYFNSPFVRSYWMVDVGDTDSIKQMFTNPQCIYAENHMHILEGLVDDNRISRQHFDEIVDAINMMDEI